MDDKKKEINNEKKEEVKSNLSKEELDKLLELERLKKENLERELELARLKAKAQGEENKQRSSKFILRKEFLFALVIGVAVIVSVLLVFGLFHTAPYRAPINSSAAYFEGSIGQLASPSILSEFSSLSNQFQQVGELLANNGTVQCNPAQVTPQGAFPRTCAIVSPSLGVYALIPLPVNESLPELTQDGKPLLVFIGAQGCPFCALQRWAIIIALSQFGNFSKLYLDRSATIDGNIPTFTFNFSSQLWNEYVVNKPPYKGEAPYGDVYPTPFFVGAYYSSPYIAFLPFDEVGGSFLINITGINSISPTIFQDVIVPSGALNGSRNGFNIYDFQFGGVPFMDIANKFVVDGAIVDVQVATPQIINGSITQFLQSLENPTPGSFGAAQLAAANVLTAQICSLINNSAPVCKLSYMPLLEAKVLSAYSH
jgi:hypothetical protein